jgi:chromosome segregation ATPase
MSEAPEVAKAWKSAWARTRARREQLEKQLDKANAEIERLTIDNRRLTEMWDTDRESLTAEIKRLEQARDMVAEEREAWKARTLEEQAENDQWQKKLAEVWKEVAELRENNKRLLADLEIVCADRDAQVDEVVRLRTAVLAYDDALRLAARRGQRIIDDDEHLDDLYAAMLHAAGRELDDETSDPSL